MFVAPFSSHHRPSTNRSEVSVSTKALRRRRLRRQVRRDPVPDRAIDEAVTCGDVGPAGTALRDLDRERPLREAADARGVHEAARGEVPGGGQVQRPAQRRRVEEAARLRVVVGRLT